MFRLIVIKIHLATIVPRDVKKDKYFLCAAIKKHVLRAVIDSTFPHQRFEDEVDFTSYRTKTRIFVRSIARYVTLCSDDRLIVIENRIYFLNILFF